jgi:hypothetical protein
VTCPNCGTENAPEAKFCVSCGRDLSDATAPIPVATPPAAGEQTEPVPAVPDQRTAAVPPVGMPAPIPSPMAAPTRPPSAISGGWLQALGRAALATLILAALGQLIAFGGVAASSSDTGFATTTKAGGIYFELFHRVGMEFKASDLSGAALGGVGGGLQGASVTISMGLLLATLIAVWLLYRAGRSIAERHGGSMLAHVVHGLKPAPFYGLLALGISLLIRFHVTLPANPAFSGRVTIQPSLLSAFLWPFAIAAVAGAAGGLRSARDHDEVVTEPWGRRTIGMLAGGVRMIALGLVFALVGLLVLAALDPDATAGYFRGAFEDGAGQGTVLVGHHVLVAPNQSMWVLVPAMGGCDRAEIAGSSIDLLCYSHFPRGITFQGGSPTSLTPPVPSIQGGTAPVGYFLFLLVPLLSVLLGGHLAASRGGSRSRPEAAALGALAGVVFGALVAIVGLMSTIGIAISADIAGFHTGYAGYIGPDVVTGGLLGLVWGTAGGALGGLIYGRKLPAVAPTEPVSPGTGFVDPGTTLPPPPPSDTQTIPPPSV